MFSFLCRLPDERIPSPLDASTTTSCTNPTDKTKQKTQLLLESDWLLAFAAMHPDASDGDLQVSRYQGKLLVCLL